jgi:hypothetical protein
MNSDEDEIKQINLLVSTKIDGVMKEIERITFKLNNLKEEMNANCIAIRQNRWQLFALGDDDVALADQLNRDHEKLMILTENTNQAYSNLHEQILELKKRACAIEYDCRMARIESTLATIHISDCDENLHFE